MPRVAESDDSPLDRIIKQSLVIESEGFGRIDAVKFDFRFPGLDLQKWSASHIMVWAVSDDGALLVRNAQFPKLWYPWFGRFNLKSFKSFVKTLYWSSLYKQYE